ncbi:MAG: hypothetical protein JO345_14400 [Streptosporangiaceae bacterium]|nr:hypothetical protein [Streptosporangiaceae bacterium]
MAKDVFDAPMAPYGDDYGEYAEYDGLGDLIDLKAAFDLPDEMPPLRLPPMADLAGLARTAPMIERLRALAEWLGTGRAVDENAELTGADAAEAATVTGMSAGRLAYLWRLALDAGFVDLDDGETHAIPGELAETFADGDDEAVLEVWDRLFGLVIGTTLEVAASMDPRRAKELYFDGHGAGLAVMLFLERGHGVPVAEAIEVMKNAATEELPPVQAEKAWQSWVRAHGDPARLLLEQMGDLGAVRVLESEDGEVARLTPLGLAALRDQFVDSGVDIPLLPPAEEMTAEDLIAMAPAVSGEEFEAEIAAWLAHRTLESAARDLLSVAADADTDSRMVAITVATGLGADAEPAWRDALDKIQLRAYAKASLSELAGDELPDLDPEDVAWMIIDTLVIDGWDDPDDSALDAVALANRLRQAIPSGQETFAFEMMARVPHPQARDVLTVIGRHHPDKKIAKMARTAAYKASTRHRSL